MKLTIVVGKTGSGKKEFAMEYPNYIGYLNPSLDINEFKKQIKMFKKFEKDACIITHSMEFIHLVYDIFGSDMRVVRLQKDGNGNNIEVEYKGESLKYSIETNNNMIY